MYAHKHVQDIDEAKDIAQNVFINLYNKSEEIKLQSSIKSYILGATKNTALNYIRNSSTRSRHNEQAMSQVTTLYEHDNLEYEELIQLVQRELSNLPPRCQEVFKLSRIQGLKNKEIADQLDISIRTVETQVSKALKHFKGLLPKFLMFFITFWVLSTCFYSSGCLLYEYKHETLDVFPAEDFNIQDEKGSEPVYKTLKTRNL